MNKFAMVLTLLAALFVVAPATARPLEDAARVRPSGIKPSMSGTWTSSSRSNTKDALFYGSTAPLFKGRDGVRTYFSQLPPGVKSQMGEQTVVAVKPNDLLSSGLVQFTLKDGTVRRSRLTLALVKVGSQWLIALHHVSPVPNT